MIRRIALRIIVTIAAVIATFFVAAVCIAIIDLYISGHGGTGLTSRHLVDNARTGVHLSVGDVIALLMAASVAAAVNLFWPRRR
jgi:hypothetical protein